ncbi:hypothetical protein CMQ_3011 [Grosmannia clavigera kw1407]|uniref:Uncharacterized protein n=1 Tax=Grosmannia clavigera (strain kw1407 / UAMH 11150) TaxID=655863 RepID=F0XGU9_GROCL|nr:uncharacterized protein CMQ_3011 [Grosmannia clavigera kw1407]EFX03082.1 hypothetical protein CMQ_3011 [Grosmannia clavigera kw1407]
MSDNEWLAAGVDISDEDINGSIFDNMIGGYFEAAIPVAQSPAPFAEPVAVPVAPIDPLPAPVAAPVAEPPAPVAEASAPVAEAPARVAQPVVEVPSVPNMNAAARRAARYAAITAKRVATMARKREAAEAARIRSARNFAARREREAAGESSGAAGPARESGVPSS